MEEKFDIQKAKERLKEIGALAGMTPEQVESDLSVINESEKKLKEFRVEADKLYKSAMLRMNFRKLGDGLILALSLASLILTFTDRMPPLTGLGVMTGCSFLLLFSRNLENEDKNETMKKLDELFEKFK